MRTGRLEKMQKPVRKDPNAGYKRRKGTLENTRRRKRRQIKAQRQARQRNQSRDCTSQRPARKVQNNAGLKRHKGRQEKAQRQVTERRKGRLQKAQRRARKDSKAGYKGTKADYNRHKGRLQEQE